MFLGSAERSFTGPPHTPTPKPFRLFCRKHGFPVFDWGIARNVVYEPKESIGRFVVGREVVRSVQPQFFPVLPHIPRTGYLQGHLPLGAYLRQPEGASVFSCRQGE